MKYELRNKLGLNLDKLLDVEKKIVNTKLNALDETFTFNEEKLNLDYLLKLNTFLFEDLYYEEDLGFRTISEEEKNEINAILRKIVSICINDPENIKGIIDLIIDIWDLQPFLNGNTRTLVAFLKVLDCGFSLDRNVDVNIDISNNRCPFNDVCHVNQKGLTK